MMDFWNNTINTALLGSSKKQITPKEVPDELCHFIEHINNSSLDAEEKFLQGAALLFNYRQSGKNPSKSTNINYTIAPKEGKAYCQAKEIQVLKDILYADNYSLLELWLQLCTQKNVIINPELIPALFTIAEKQTSLQTMILECCGERGKWLSNFNPAWNFSSSASDEELWQTGTTEQRKIALINLRNTAPSKARELLQETWNKESANTKAELLSILSFQLSKEDEPWLESLLSEKSQKVKDEVWNLLKSLPDSAIISKYKILLQQTVIPKKEKALLGLLNKNKIEIKIPSFVDEIIYKSGIEKLSSSKEISDDEYLAYQLIQFIPPDFLTTLFNDTPEGVLEILKNDSTGKKWISALAKSIERFQNQYWAIKFTSAVDIFYGSMASLLPDDIRKKYLLKHFNHSPDDIIQECISNKNEWDQELTKAIIQHTSKNYYQYTKSFYNKIILQIPVEFKNELTKISVEDTIKGYWENTKGHLTQLLSLKEQTIQSFKK